MIVIHPGSNFTRIGRACDVNPTTVPSVVARKLRGDGIVPKPTYVKGIERPQPGMERTKPIQGNGGGDEYSVSSQSNDPVSSRFLSSSSYLPPPSFVGRELRWQTGLVYSPPIKEAMTDHLRPCITVRGQD